VTQPRTTAPERASGPHAGRSDPLAGAGVKHDPQDTRRRLEAVWNSISGVMCTAYKTRWFIRGDSTIYGQRGEKSREYKPKRKVRTRPKNGRRISKVSGVVGPGEGT
jgi:hypothetical protein